MCIGDRADRGPDGIRMGRSDSSSSAMEERARKREAIGLAPRRPTAKAVVNSPPEARRGIPFIALAIVVLAAVAAGLVIWRASNITEGSFGGRTLAPPAEERLIARDDFADPQFKLPIRANAESEQRYVGDLYQIRILRPGGRAWATLGQLNLGAYRLAADLRLALQEELSWGYGGLIVRFQNQENFYLFVVDGQGEYQIQLIENGAWRTIQPWTHTPALSSGSQNLLSVADDGVELSFFINAIYVTTVPNPRLPVGDVGLVVGARSQGQAQGLFDWVALYEIPIAR